MPPRAQQTGATRHLETDKDIDAALETITNQHKSGEAIVLYPPYPGGVPRPKKLTALDLEKCEIWRKFLKKRREGPLWTGPYIPYHGNPFGKKRTRETNDTASFNAFAGHAVRSNVYGEEEKERRPQPDIARIKFCMPQCFPRELWSTIGYSGEKITVAPRRVARKADESAFEDEEEGDASEGEKSDEGGEKRMRRKKEDDEEFGGEDSENEDEVSDDEPGEDDDLDEDPADDYNAQKYYEEDGDEVDGDGGGDGYDEGVIDG